MQSLQNAVQEFENFTQSISDGINKDQVKGLASDVGEQSKNVFQQTLNLLAYSMVQVSAFISPYCSHSNCSTKKFSNAVLILHQLSNCKQRRQYESAVCIPTSQFQSTKLQLLCRSLDRNVTSIHTLPCHKQISVNYVNDLLCTDSVLHNVK